MKKEDYAGGREMSRFVEHMWGWQVTVPSAVDKAKWEQTYEVYVEDKYGLDIEAFLGEHNPWAYQSITARMLEAIRKEYWDADDKIRQKLAVEYATCVVEKGVACCDHTCNNPLLNQMVVNILSLPGLMSPEMVEKFKLAIEKATQKTLDQQTQDLRRLQAELKAGFERDSSSADRSKARAQQERRSAAQKTGEASEAVEGYKMEDIESTAETTEAPSSGVQWCASLLVLVLLGLFAFGMRRGQRY